ncbi:MAG: hypothetical protein ACLSDJ_04415 [Butyricimonas faecihominis]
MKNLLQDNLKNVVFKIFATYYARIVYFAFQIIGDREEAEDIAQDTFRISGVRRILVNMKSL